MTRKKTMRLNTVLLLKMCNNAVKSCRPLFLRRQSTSADEPGQADKSLLGMHPIDFTNLLRDNSIRRCYAVYDAEEKKVKVSHPELKELSEFLLNESNFQQHEAMFFELGRRTGMLLGTFVWRTTRGQALGGIRMWNYPTMESFLKDGMRLSVGMGVKSALAGLWVGGGQGIIPELPDKKHLLPDFRPQIFYDFGDFLSGLNGLFVAAEDLGLNVYDINNVHSRTRFVTGISEDMGGHGNPSFAAAKGVICAMEAALDFLKLGTLSGKTVAVQGAGNVGSVLVSELLERDVSHVYVTDCMQKRIDDLKDGLAQIARGRLEIVKVPFNDTSIMSRQCDILSPCALGNILNADSISNIRARIVCGAANNQLGAVEDNQLLIDNGIVYVVDYLANRMGMVIVDKESDGRLTSDPAIKRHFTRDWENSIFVMTKRILQKAKDENQTPIAAANKLAESLSHEPHPLLPGRGQLILRALLSSGWHNDMDFWSRRSNYPSARPLW